MGGHRTSIISSVVIAFFLVALMVGCATVYNPVARREQITLIGERGEIQIGKATARGLERRYGLVEEATLNERVGTVGENLVRVSGRAHLPYQFKVLRMKDVNAFAIPGGFVYITEGLMNEIETDSQLAGVLGHEMAHISARHAIRRMEIQIGYSVLAGLLLGETPQDLQRLANITFHLVSLGYSREDEFEADEWGIKYAYKAGYDPYGLAEVLKILKASYERVPSRIETFFSTHPHVDDRIKRAEALANALTQ